MMMMLKTRVNAIYKQYRRERPR